MYVTASFRPLDGDAADTVKGLGLARLEAVEEAVVTTLERMGYTVDDVGVLDD